MQEVEESPTKYMAFDHLIEGAQVITPDYKYYYVNQTVAKQGKSTVEELMGEFMTEAYPGIDKTAVFENLKKCMQSRRQISFEDKFDFPDGSSSWFDLRMHPVEEGVLILSFDITRHKLAEEVLSSRYVQMLEKKNNELEKFASIAAHDLQQPLATVNAFVDFLQKDYASVLDNDAHGFMTHIQNGVKRMRALVSGLLAYSRTGRNTEVDLVDLNKTIDDLRCDLSLMISENNAEISADDLPVIEGCEIEFRMLFQNFITNAMRFRVADKPPKIHISYSDSPSHHSFCFADNGVGIREEDLTKVFQLLETGSADREVAGSGIGLAICKKVIDKLDGEIWVESRPDIGSKFYITVPK